VKVGQCRSKANNSSTPAAARQGNAASRQAARPIATKPGYPQQQQLQQQKLLDWHACSMQQASATWRM